MWDFLDVNWTWDNGLEPDVLHELFEWAALFNYFEVLYALFKSFMDFKCQREVFAKLIVDSLLKFDHFDNELKNDFLAVR